jgi:RNA polymerase sigma-70 factor, ECF subfamily
MVLQRSATLVVSSTTDQQFDLVFNRYGGFVYTVAQALLKNRQDAEDAVQEVFIRVYRSLDNYDEIKGNMEAWLRAILLNYCRDKWRKRSLLSIPISLLAHNQDGEDGNWEEALANAGVVSNQEAGPDMTLLRREREDELWVAVNSLSEKLRRVVVLRYYMDLSDNEVAETLGLPKGTIYSRLHAAHLRLQALLNPGEER